MLKLKVNLFIIKCIYTGTGSYCGWCNRCLDFKHLNKFQRKNKINIKVKSPVNEKYIIALSSYLEWTWVAFVLWVFVILCELMSTLVGLNKTKPNKKIKKQMKASDA